MVYTTIKVKGNELKLRLDARNTVALERKLGRNPLDVFMEVGNGKIPPIECLIAILYCSLQPLEHGYTEDKVYTLYDEYIEDGNSLMDLLEVIVNIFEVSGFMKKDESADEKNG